MEKNIKQVVSMLVSEEKVMLITAQGDLIDIKTNGPYDLSGIIEYLNTELTGSNVVEIDLNTYLTMAKAIIPEDYQAEGIVISHQIDGQTVQGIFYPQKMSVNVKTSSGAEVAIPKVEKLAKHADRAAMENSPSIRNFLRRVGDVIEKRKHSAEDLMDFIERSELPLTNDGRIIGYKRVNERRPGVYVDCHSGMIEQSIGSQVWMEGDKVDPSRTNSCSNGLHVANLGYLRGFRGSHTLIVLVDPAEFIAVPHGETNKARVAQYDVIGVMTSNSQKLINNGGHVVNDDDFESLIARAVKGEVVQPFERVKVGDKRVLERTRIVGVEAPKLGLEEAKPETKVSGKSLNEDPEKKKKDVMSTVKNTATPWDNAPTEILKAFDALFSGMSKTEAANIVDTSTRTLGRWMDKYDYDAWVKSKEGSMTIADRARAMFKSAQFEALAGFKKMKKKSWNALGFNNSEVSKIEKAIS